MIVALLQRFRWLRHLPVWVRYLSTSLIVLACFAARYWLGKVDTPADLPLFLVFMPAVILASFLFDRGSGFVAVFLSAVIGSYFFIEPVNTMGWNHLGEIARVGAFIVIGTLTASIIEALRGTVEDLSVANRSLAEAKAEAQRGLSLLSAVLDGTPDPIFVKDREGRYMQANAATALVFGAGVENLIGRRDRELAPLEEALRMERTDAEVIESRRPLTSEETVTRIDGSKRTYLTTKAPWFDNERNVCGVIGVARDIHERKLAEDRLRTAHAHKQLLLEDINHRIKNHLQSIAGLMATNKRSIADPQCRWILETAIGQLHVLSRVYDRLQLQETATSVDARQFIEGLCSDLKATVADRPVIALRVSAEALTLNSSHAVLLGLIVNELVTNALKYAFPDAREGKIAVRLWQDEGNVHLEIRDDGIGMSMTNSDEIGNAGSGLRLVRALARELGGRIEWSAETSGTRAILKFPVSTTVS